MRPVGPCRAALDRIDGPRPQRHSGRASPAPGAKFSQCRGKTRSRRLADRARRNLFRSRAHQHQGDLDAHGAGRHHRSTRRGQARNHTGPSRPGAEHQQHRRREVRDAGRARHQRQCGVRLTRDASYITLADLEIHDIAVGINFNGNIHNVTVRRNHIYRAARTGEGMYVGCNYARCIVSDTLIE